VATNKLSDLERLVADPAGGPALDRLVDTEASSLIVGISAGDFDLAAPPSMDMVVPRLERYAAITADLASAAALGCRCSGAAVSPIWAALIERVVGGVARGTGQTLWQDLSLYPGVLVLHAGGVGALAGGRYDNLRAILLDARIKFRHESHPAIGVLHSQAFLDDRSASAGGLRKSFAPTSDRLASDLRPLVSSVVHEDAAFERLFDRLETFMSLVYMDRVNARWAPTGRFVTLDEDDAVDRELADEIKERGSSWAPLAAGFFGGSYERLTEVLGAWRTYVAGVRNEARFYRHR